jgi:RHS repeat-associated protein
VTILDVLAVSPAAEVSSPRRRSCRSPCRRACPHGFERNRWYPGRDRDLKVEWDFEDRLVKVTKSDGTVVENVYDVDGVLVRTSVNGVATDYLVDTSGALSHVVAEIDGSGAVTTVYVRAGDMLLEEIRSGVEKMYEADGLGSVRCLLDVSGAKTDTYAYEAFGSTVSTTGGDLNPYRFAGERLVDSVGFYQNRARWLDTRTGRFVSVDPWEGDEEEPLSLHRYIYAAEDPPNSSDPSGRLYDSNIPSVTLGTQLSGQLEAQNATRSISLGFRIVAAMAAAGMIAGSISPLPITGTEDNKGQGGEILYRRPAGRESVTRLARKAAEAEEEMGLHGVSAFCTPLSDSSRAPRVEVEKFFNVMDTRGPNHRTILLPKPVTKEVADSFNRVFGRL